MKNGHRERGGEKRRVVGCNEQTGRQSVSQADRQIHTEIQR